MVIISIWLLAATFSCVSFAIYKPLYESDPVTGIISLITLIVVLIVIVAREKEYKYNDTFYGLCLSGAAVSVVALAITFIAIYRRPKVTNTRSASLSRRRRRENIKAACLLSFMFTAVLVWLVPVVSLQTRGIKLNAYIAMYLGRFCISIFNPVLYTLCKQDIRAAANKDLRAILRFLSRNLCAKRLEERVSNMGQSRPSETRSSNTQL